MNVQSITLDLSKRQIPAQIVRIGQGDNEGTTIQAKILDNGVSTNLAGMTATMEMRLPDGSAYASGGRCTVSGSVVTCVVDEEYFAAVAGYTDEAYFKLTSGSTVYSTSRFRVKVERAASDGATPVVPWEDAAAELIARVNQQVNAAVSSANTATGNANSAANSANAAATNANATANGVESRVQQIAQSAAQQATADAEGRIDAAIDAMGDISELAVPLMTPDVRGGAKLEQHGGLALRDGSLGIGSLVQESDGYARGGLAEVTAKGHAEQLSTAGKNLLPMLLSTIKTLNTTGTWSGNTYTKGTAVFTFETIGESITKIIVNGTALNTVGNALTLGNNITIQAGTYTLSGGVSGPLRVYVNYGSEWRNATSSPDTFTISSSVTISSAIVLAGTETLNNVTFYPQLELGSTATAFEPYTGGAPSPSPNYMQEIQVVRGRNLLPLTLAGIKAANGGTWNGNVCTIRNCTFTIVIDGNGAITGIVANGTASDTNVELNLVVNNTFFPRAGTYTLSGGATSSVRIFYYDGTTYYDSKPSPKTFSLTGSETVTRCVCVIARGTTANNDVLYPQLERGSVAHPYVPYGHVGLEVQGRNLLGGLSSDSSNGITSTLQSNGTMSVSGTANGTAICRILNDKPLDMEIGITYTLDMGVTIPDVRYELYGTNDTSSVSNFVLVTSIPFNQKSATFTLGDAYNYYRLNLIVSSGKTVSSKTVYPQLNAGSTATEYEPYFHTTTSITLPQRGWVASLPDGTADVLTLDGAGKVEWEEATEEVVLDGVINACTSVSTSSQSGIPQLYLLLEGVRPATSNNKIVPIRASAFRAASSNAVWDNSSDGYIAVTTTSYLQFSKSGVTSKTDANTWLASNPITVLYPLATPVTEEVGYVDMPAIPSDATVTIRELDDLGIRYFVDDTVTRYGREIYARVRSEYADRITALEQAVAELATS